MISQRDVSKMLIEFLIVLSFITSFTLIISLFVYFKKIRVITNEYLKARNVVESIILSFNNDIKHVNNLIQEISVKNVNNNLENTKDIKELYKKIDAINSLYNNSTLKNSINNQKDTDIYLNNERLKGQKNEIYNVSKDDQINMMLKYKKIEDKENDQFTIDISRKQIFNNLTKTETNIIEFLIKNGNATAPIIRKQIGLTREHTARLMKKLFNMGFLERETQKIPYIYSLTNKFNDLFVIK